MIAVGTTVTRALETAADRSAAAGRDGLGPASGWTELVLGPGRPAPGSGRHRYRLARARRVAPGLCSPRWPGRTWWPPPTLEAIRHGYLWHEFGDSCLLLPPVP